MVYMEKVLKICNNVWWGVCAFSSEYTKSIDIDELKAFLDKDSNFKYAETRNRG